jgi:hypothetical protein
MEQVRLDRVRYQVNEAWTVPYWIDETQFEGQASLTGTVCGLDRPFTLTLDGIIGNGRTVGEVLFLPVSKTGGTWSFEGTASVSGGSTSVTGSSTYQLVGVADEAPAILMDAASNIDVKVNAGFMTQEGQSLPGYFISLALVIQ